MTTMKDTHEFNSTLLFNFSPAPTNATGNVTQETDSNPWYKMFPPIYVSIAELTLEFSALSLMAILGTFMNMVVIYLLLKTKSAQSTASFLVLNLAVTDVIQTGITVPLNMYGLLIEYWNLGYAMCIFGHSVLSIPYNISFWGHMALALHRLCLLKINSRVAKVLARKMVNIIFLINLWVLQIVLHLFLAYLPSSPAQVHFIPAYGLCGVSTTGDSEIGYIIVMTFLSIDMFLPFVICLIIYCIILRSVHKQVLVFPTQLHRKSYHEATRYSTILFLVFVICWLPEYLRVLLDKEGVSPIWVVRLCSFACYFNSAINPYIYAFRCRPIQKALLKSFPIVSTVVRQSQVHPSSPRPYTHSRSNRLAQANAVQRPRELTVENNSPIEAKEGWAQRSNSPNATGSSSKHEFGPAVIGLSTVTSYKKNIILENNMYYMSEKNTLHM